MVRLLIVCIMFLLLYLGVFVLSQLDSTVTLGIYDYYLETTFFTFIIFFILLVVIGFIILNIIFLIIKLPYRIQALFSARKIGKVNYSLMKSMAEYIIGNKLKGVEIVKKISPYIGLENKEFYTLILAESVEEITQKIQFLQELEKLKSYAAFAVKRLAQILYGSNEYEQAKNYAIKSLSLNEFDHETLEILIDCYGKLALWTKLISVASKLSRVDKQKLSSIEGKIAGYYLAASRNMTVLGQEEDAIHYLELSLKLHPANIEALNLYCTLNLRNNIEMFKIAFVTKPSFGIVELYRKYSNLSALQIYEDLFSLVDPIQYFSLFLAIAAYLDLPEQYKFLKKQQNNNFVIN